MAKKTTVKKKPQVHKSLVIVGLIIFTLFLLGRNKKTDDLSVEVSVKEEVSQLTSSDKYVGNGFASRAYSDSKFSLNLTAFLPKLGVGEVYEARLIGESLDPKIVNLGELISAGDVFALSFVNDTDYRGYNSIEVVLRVGAAKTEKVLLKGSF